MDHADIAVSKDWDNKAFLVLGYKHDRLDMVGRINLLRADGVCAM